MIEGINRNLFMGDNFERWGGQGKALICPGVNYEVYRIESAPD